MALNAVNGRLASIMMGCNSLATKLILPLVITLLLFVVSCTPRSSQTPDSNSQPNQADILGLPTSATADPVPEKTALPMPTLALTPTLAPTELAPTPNPTPLPTLTVAPLTQALPKTESATYLVVGVEQDDALNLRAEPGVNGAIIATIPPLGQGIQMVVEPSQKSADLNWVEIVYADQVGWVNRAFLAEQVGAQTEPAVAQIAWQTLAALRDQSMGDLAAVAHPEGIRFAPYTYLSGDEMMLDAALLQDVTRSETYYWGIRSGVGDPIELSIPDYFDHFVYAADYFNPDTVLFNEPIEKGTMIDNNREVYPDATFVDYYVAGSEEFGGLDWRILRLVLEQTNGEWVVSAIINNEWTP